MSMISARGSLARDVVLPAVAAGAVIVGIGTGVVTMIAGGEPAPAPAPGPTAIVTTTDAPGRLAPRCFETSSAGAEDCVWVPVAPCRTDEAGDEAIPPSFEGCYWDADARGNREGASYVYWRLNRG